MELKNPVFLVSQSWKKIVQINAFVASIQEIHLFYVESNSLNNIKLVYNEKGALLERGCHLNTCDRNSSHFIRFPGGSDP